MIHPYSRIIFVYGTLLQGFSNHRILSTYESQYIGDYRLMGRMYSCYPGGGFPYFQYGKGTKFYKGELYFITEECWERCVRLEGDMYEAKTFEIEHPETLEMIKNLKTHFRVEMADEKIICHFFHAKDNQINPDYYIRQGSWVEYIKASIGGHPDKKWDEWTTKRLKLPFELNQWDELNGNK